MNPIFNKSLSNFDINKLVTVNNFRGCFMRDELKNIIPNEIESGVLNLDTSNNNGTHWVCWVKINNLILYFDSFGLVFPDEIHSYFKQLKNYKGIYYSNLEVQPAGSVICGHLCIYLINNNPKTKAEFLNLITNLLI